jgi:hypothetical protein
MRKPSSLDKLVIENGVVKIRCDNDEDFRVAALQLVNLVKAGFTFTVAVVRSDARSKNSNRNPDEKFRLPSNQGSERCAGFGAITFERTASFENEVRTPELLFDQKSRGEITLPMLLAMIYLRKWADWRTGKVAHASAAGLCTATREYSVRTFQAAMKKLEEMGWITQHIVHGSRTDFPVTLHNFKWRDQEDGKVHILNSKPLVTPAVEKRRHRPAKKGTSKTSVTEGCGRNEPETTDHNPENANEAGAAVRAAVEDDVRNVAGDHENTSTFSDTVGRGCGRTGDEAATRSYLSSCLNSSKPPQQKTDTIEEEPPVAGATDYTGSLRSKTNPNPILEELDENFQPDASNRRYARMQGLNLEEELAAFKDIHGSLGNKRENWQKVLRKWLIDAAPLRGHVVDLPDWMPLTAWKEYLAMRERIGRGATKAAEKLLIGALGELRGNGYSVAQVLDKCVAREWRDVRRAAAGITTGSLTQNMRDLVAKHS